MTKDELSFLADGVKESVMLCHKKILTPNEVATYLGLSKSYLYKLTMHGAIPYYCPMGKKIYFERDEVEKWVLKHRIRPNDEIQHEVQIESMQEGGSK